LHLLRQSIYSKLFSYAGQLYQLPLPFCSRYARFNITLRGDLFCFLFGALQVVKTPYGNALFDHNRYTSFWMETQIKFFFRCPVAFLKGLNTVKFDATLHLTDSYADPLNAKHQTCEPKLEMGGWPELREQIPG
jgi:hypothetical protein